MSAYYPTQREIEEEYLAKNKSVSPSTILLARHDLLSVKRENFKYALRKTLPAFFELLKNLKYDGFPPVQNPPLVIGGGVAVSILTNTPLDTPDLDVELSGFSLDYAGGNANANVVLSKEREGALFNRYCHSLFEQIRSKIAETPDMFGAYGEIVEDEKKYDIEVRNGEIIRGEKIGRIWLSMIYNKGYFSKIVILAKIGEFVETINGSEKHTPSIERILEIKLPKKIFTPLPVGEALVYKEDIGLWFASREKMLPEILKSFGDKCGALSRLAKDYDMRIFPGVLAHDGYFDLIEEPQKREEIINYKVRIITLRERLRIFGAALESISICSPFLQLSVIPYITDAEKADAAEKARLAEEARLAEVARLAEEEKRQEEAKKAKREAKKARLAAEKAAAEQAAAEAEAARAARAAADVEAAKAARAAQEAEAKRIADAKAAKAVAKAKAKQAGRASPEAVSVVLESVAPAVAPAVAAAGGESVAPAVAAAGGGGGESVVVSAAPQILKPNSFICFTEGLSTSNSETLNNLETTLNNNYPQESGVPEILCLEVVTPVGRLIELGERKPLKPGFNYAQDGKMLNGVEELVCRTIQQILDFHKVPAEIINKRFGQIVDFLTWISWDINDKSVRDSFIKPLFDWLKRTNGKDLTQDEMKDTYANFFQWIHTLLNILFLQVNELQGNYTFPRPYQHNELFIPFENIVKEIRSSKLNFPFKISEANSMVLVRLSQTLFATAKGRLILVRLEEEYGKYVAKVAARGLRLNDMPPPVIFFPYPRLLTSEIISVMWSCLVNAEILFLPKMYTLTSLFIELDKSDELVSEEVSNLSQAILMPFNAGEDLRSINFEMILEVIKSLWFINADDDTATIALKKKAKNIIAIVLLSILEKYNDFVSFNTLEFWQKIIQVDISDIDEISLQINEELASIKEKELNRITLFNAMIQKVLVEKHIEEVKQKDTQKEAAILAEKERLAAEKARVAAEKVVANAAEKEKQKQTRIQSLADLLGISIAEATKEVENENAGGGGGGRGGGEGGGGGGGGGGGSKKVKGKGGKGKRTRKNLRR